MAFVGFALLLEALCGQRPWRAFVIGTVWGLAFFLPHLWWAYEATAAVPWILLSASQALFIGAFGALWSLVTRRGTGVAWRHAAGAATIWTAVEALRGVWPFGGFTWGSIAFSQTPGPLLRIASLGGIVGVTFVATLAGALLWASWRHLRAATITESASCAVLAVAVVAVTFAIPVDARAETGTLTVGVVQGNVTPTGHDPGSVSRDVFERHLAGTAGLAADTVDYDLVLWPENSADYDPRISQWAAARMDEATAEVGAPIVFGSVRYTDDARYNDLGLWQEGAGETARYTKQRPAPFGEYIPLRDLARRVTDQVDRVTVDMLPGETPAVIAVPVERLDRDVRIALAICFEVAYLDLLREGVLQGGEMIAVPTNNSSFGHTEESSQQLAMSVLQSVTHGRAVVHVSNVGISAVIAPNGVITQRTDHYTADQLTAVVPLRESVTVADRLGRAPEIVVGALAILCVLAAAVRGRGTSEERTS